MPPIRNIVRGQVVAEEKIERAKELRQDMTPAEKRLWDCLRKNRLDGLHFRRQQVIDGFIVDFYCHAAALVVEIDGEIHEQQAAADAERDQVLSQRVCSSCNSRMKRFDQEYSTYLLVL